MGRGRKLGGGRREVHGEGEGRGGERKGGEGRGEEGRGGEWSGGGRGGIRHITGNSFTAGYICTLYARENKH